MSEISNQPTGKIEAEIRPLSEYELTTELFSHFHRRQIVQTCLREINGQFQEVNAPFIDDWSQEDFQFLLDCLKNTIVQHGVVFGAFVNQQLKGFCSVEGTFYGRHQEYADMTALHVSEDVRNRGIGKKLFNVAKVQAKQQGAKKLYISSHSAIETQRFYEAMGCVDAVERLPHHTEQEPYDRQLECSIL